MHIAIDASRANTTQRTGVERYVHEFLAHLRDVIPTDVRVTLYLRESPLADFLVIPAHWQIKVLRWSPIYLWTHLRLALEVWRDKPDVFFVPAHVMPIVLPTRVRKVVTLHDVAFVFFPQSYSRVQRLYQYWAVYFAKWFCDRVIVPSRAVELDLIEKFSFPEKKIAVVPHGFSAFVVERSAEAPSQKYFLSVGRLETKKNTLLTVRAFEKFCEKQEGYEVFLVGKP